jgi:glycosyltransferase involved in cell wall biosynthesis
MPLPADIADLRRPVAGVIGNLGENTDWELIEEAVNSTSCLTWLFVGPYTAPIHDAKQASSRQRLLEVGGRVRFTGPRDSGDLKNYARSVDVAILPYRKREPTYSGSSTRFYEHLAACRPMIATKGFEELLHKTSVLRLADSPDDLVEALEDLRSKNFQDGLIELRWKMSRQNTWEDRARQMIDAIQFGIGRAAVPAEARNYA